MVGNITVGGTGKTPFVIWLAEFLAVERCRASASCCVATADNSKQWPRDVSSDTSCEDVGDEAVLLAGRTAAIVVAGPDRVADALMAIDRGAEVVLSDDGLQHYRLARDCEIAVVDAKRVLGNGRLLPAGPLREPRDRLSSVDMVVLRGSGHSPTPSLPIVATVRQVRALAVLREAVSLTTGERRPLESFRDGRVHALAAIGHPQAFFDALSTLGLDVDVRALPDHAQLTAGDISFADDRPVLMTEKDAVKCRVIADRRHWAVRMDIEMSAADLAIVSDVLGRFVAMDNSHG